MNFAVIQPRVATFVVLYGNSAVSPDVFDAQVEFADIPNQVQQEISSLEIVIVIIVINRIDKPLEIFCFVWKRSC